MILLISGWSNPMQSHWILSRAIIAGRVPIHLRCLWRRGAAEVTAMLHPDATIQPMVKRIRGLSGVI